MDTPPPTGPSVALDEPALDYFYYVGPPVKQLGLKQFYGPFIPRPGENPFEAIPQRYRRLMNLAGFWRNLFVTVREMPAIMAVITTENSPIWHLRERAGVWLKEKDNVKRLM